MTKVLVTEESLARIGSAIRQKNKSADTYRPAEMAEAILDIETGIAPTGTIPINANGTVDVTDYASANVNVQPRLQAKTVTANGTVTPDEGYDGLSEVVVDVQGGGGGGFIVDEWSEYFTNYLDTGLSIDTRYTVEVCFYANAYINDGHIVGSVSTSAGNAYHITTYSNRWYGSNGSYEYNFAADSENYPLYGMEIVFRTEPDGKVYMNGNNVATNAMGTTGSRYALNTRGGGASTNGVYRYKYMKIWDENGNLIYDLSFGHIEMSNMSLKMAHEAVSDSYFPY